MNDDQANTNPQERNHPPPSQPILDPASAREWYEQKLAETNRRHLAYHGGGLRFYYSLGQKLHELTHESRKPLYGEQVLDRFVEDMNAKSNVQLKHGMYELSLQIFRTFNPEELELAIKGGCTLRDLKFLAGKSISPELRRKALVRASNCTMSSKDLKTFIREEKARARQARQSIQKKMRKSKVERQ